MNIFSVAFALMPALAVGQTCDPSAVSSVPLLEEALNGCLYGTCQSSGDMTSWPCVYSSAECAVDTVFLDANTAATMGKLCTCTDILNFPSLIGSCRHPGGIDSPMATADDCANGSPVCPADDSGMYTIGDTDGLMEFTACDLACDYGNGHAGQVPSETYQSCEFPTIGWATASVGDDGGMAGNNIASAIINGVSTVIVAGEAYGNVEFRGPFTPTNPTGSGQGVTNLEHSVEEPNEGRRPWDATFYMVNGETGAPLEAISVTNPGTAYVHGLGVAGKIEPTLMALGGEFASSADGTGMVAPTAKCTPTEYNDQGASITCDKKADGMFVTTLIPTTDGSEGWPGYIVAASPRSGEIQWMIMAPWLQLSDQELADGRTLSEHSVLGIQISDDGADMYVTGFKSLAMVEGKNPPADEGTFKYTGVVCRLNGSDGSTVWCNQYPELKYAIKSALDQDGDSLYFTAEMESTSSAGALGVTCDNPYGGCSLLIRISTDGVLEWVRVTDGYQDRPWESGEVHLAKDGDGPFVYAAFQDAGVIGPTSLDQGSHYSGCILQDGSLLPEYDPSIDQTTVLNQTGCSAIDAAATFFGRDSDIAIPAYVASTGAHCFGASGTSCLVKYHKSNGFPVWGASKHRISSFVPQDDFIASIGVLSSDGPFDSVIQGSTRGALDGYGIIWGSEMSVDGEGISVFPLVTSPRSYAGGCALTEGAGDAIFASFYFASSAAKFGPGAPAGWELDTGVDSGCADSDIVCEGPQRLTVAKFDDDVQQPSCIQSCSGGYDNLQVTPGYCFVEQFCYADDETAASLGHPCQACDAASNSLVPFEVGTNYCFIDDACYPEGASRQIQVGRWETLDSECEQCVPTSDGYAWTLKEGFELTDGECVGPNTILDVILDSPDHTKLAEIAVAAGVTGLLSDAQAELTIFAPTDAAILAMETDLGAPIAMLDPALVAGALTYHLVQGKVMAEDISSGPLVTLLAGDSICVEVTADGVMLNGLGMVTVADIPADNGVVHVIDALLIPNSINALLEYPLITCDAPSTDPTAAPVPAPVPAPVQAPVQAPVPAPTTPTESAAWMAMESFVVKSFVGLLPLLLL